MSDTMRRLGALGAVAFCAIVLAVPLPVAALASSPEPTTPETTAGPATTVPDTSEPDDTAPGDTLVGAGDPDDDINNAVAVIAVIGFAALLGVASWWMVRRPGPDSQPMPPSPPSDLI